MKIKLGKNSQFFVEITIMTRPPIYMQKKKSHILARAIHLKPQNLQWHLGKMCSPYGRCSMPVTVHDDTHINTMTRSGLGAGLSENYRLQTRKSIEETTDAEV